jgi:hypothetical protein
MKWLQMVSEFVTTPTAETTSLFTNDVNAPDGTSEGII